jgi:hypothetical protein
VVKETAYSAISAQRATHTQLRRRMALRQIGRVRRDLVGDHALPDVVAVAQADTACFGRRRPIRTVIRLRIWAGVYE